MALTTLPRAGMLGMARGIVLNHDSGGREGGGKLSPDAVGDAHGEAFRVRFETTARLPIYMTRMTFMGSGLSGLSGLFILSSIMSRPSIASYAGPDPVAATRHCEHPGCGASGEDRAPRSRADLQQYYWFCLDHVRTYNAAWNYYAGMSADEIEREIRRDTVWQRPSWPLGARVGFRYNARLGDHGMFGFDEEGERVAGAKHQQHHPTTPEGQALAVFDLQLPVTLPGLKARYKELVKLNHPDAHGGDKDAEERLKIINQAYSMLKATYFN